ncbi:CARDB domain-containing protein, partial [Haloplanus sp.]|uniref:CARDB domain-containing protein n=1 Tax=Haloplanus sp. TaxID=1961696 RepID=UPI00260DA90B
SPLSDQGLRDRKPTFGRWLYTPAEGQLTDNALNDTDPALAGNGQNYTIAWSGEAPDRPQHERKEIYVRSYATGDGSFSNRVRVTDDTAYNINPSVARSDGVAVVAWERMEADSLEGTTPDFQDVRNTSEVAYAINDGSGWSSPRVVTNDSRYQGDPAVVSYRDGFVLAWERDNDYNFTSRTDVTVEYVRLNGSAAVVSNGTVGDGLNLRAADGGGNARLAYERPRDGSTPVLEVAEVNRSVTPVHSVPVGNLTTYDVANDSVAYGSGPGGGFADEVRLRSDGETATVPLGNGTTVRELRLATVGDRRLLQYQGASPSADEGALPNQRTTYYQLFRNGAWSAPRTVAQALNGTQILYDHSVTTNEESFLSVAAGADFGEQADDELYFVDHSYQPELSVRVSTAATEAVANATVGETVRFNATVTNTGDEEPASAVTLGVETDRNGTATTIDAGTIAPGNSSTVTVERTVGDTGRIRLIADPNDDIAELNEGNNTATLIATRPDLAVAETTQSQTENGVRVNATLRNDGPTIVTRGDLTLSSNGTAVANSTLNRTLGPGETANLSVVARNGSFDTASGGTVTARAVGPIEQSRQNASLDRVSLLRPDLRLRAGGLRTFRYNGTPVVAVTYENRGFVGAQPTIELRYGNRSVSRAVCARQVPANRSAASHRRFVVAPGLEADDTVTVDLNASDPVGRDNGGSVVAGFDRNLSAAVPLVSGQLPRDADCDGAYEDLNGDGELTEEDVALLFEARNNESLRGQRSRFDLTGDAEIDVHDTQALLSEIDAAEGNTSSSNGSSSSTAVRAPGAAIPVDPLADGRQTVDQQAFQTDRGGYATTVQTGEPTLSVDSGTVDLQEGERDTIVVSVSNDVPVGAFNISVLTRGGVASVADVRTIDARFNDTITTANERSITAAGHGNGSQLIAVTIRGQSVGDGELLIDTNSISDNEGDEYTAPATQFVPIRVQSGTGNGDIYVPIGPDPDRNEADSPSPSTPAPTPEQPPSLKITNVTAGQETLEPGDEITVRAQVENVGGAGETRPTLSVNGTLVERRSVTLETGETVVVQFSETLERPGRYTLEVNGTRVGEVTVASTPTATVVTDRTPTAATPSPTATTNRSPTMTSSATATPTPTTTRSTVADTPTQGQESTETSGQDGFGVVALAAAMAAGALLARRRR